MDTCYSNTTVVDRNDNSEEQQQYNRISLKKMTKCVLEKQGTGNNLSKCTIEQGLQNLGTRYHQGVKFFLKDALIYFITEQKVIYCIIY